MKKVTLIITLFFTLLTAQTFAQEFYPLNLLSLATVKNVDGKVAIRAEIFKEVTLSTELAKDLKKGGELKKW